ncbi:MAG: HDIG domain-containing protein [Oscillospiraceae bacterium]|nr:HDIG domain-containing protein [Oscillospiraceae bacterium]
MGAGGQRRRPRNAHFAVIAAVTVALSFAIVFSGASSRFIELAVGDVSTLEIRAPRDVEDKFQTRVNGEKAAAEVSTVFEEIAGATVDIMIYSHEVFTKILHYRSASGMDELTGGRFVEQCRKELEGMSLFLSDAQVRYLLGNLSDNNVKDIETSVNNIITQIAREKISEDSLIGCKNRAIEMFRAEFSNELLVSAVSAILSNAIIPNVAPNEELTNAAREEARNRPGNVAVIPQGDVIVSVGERVTQHVYELLEAIGMLQISKFDWVQFASIMGVVILASAAIASILTIFFRNTFPSLSSLIMMCALILFALGLTRWLMYYSYMMTPFLLAPILIAIMVDTRVAVYANVFIAVLISMMSKGDFELLIICLVGGLFAAVLVTRSSQRSMLSLTGVFIGLINVALLLSVRLFHSPETGGLFLDAVIIFFNGLVSVILAIGMMPFMEAIFKIVTPYRLLELTNADNALLKRLIINAPGTYHHSIMVGNMAEMAAEAIGANTLMSRAAAYFHDCGKLLDPNMFKENQYGENPHDMMTPYESAAVISRHPMDGYEIAAKHKIPAPVRNVIVSHHGTTPMSYFLVNAQRLYGEPNVRVDDFRYPGPKPQTKEGAIIMLADSVEAAVRSMGIKEEEALRAAIGKIMQAKMDDGQLDECDITFNEIAKVGEAFLRAISGFFHKRVQYPTAEGLTEAESGPVRAKAHEGGGQPQ